MDKSKLKLVVADQRKAFLSASDYVPRSVDTKKLIQSEEIIVISGIRRSGKSTLMKMLAQDLLEKNPAENIFYLNFDDERLVKFGLDDFSQLLEIFFEQCQKGKHYFFLDEVQTVVHWEKWVNRLSEQENIKVFVTGSNASLLSSEISTSLTGRNIVLEIFPFSFSEFLRLNNYDLLDANTKQRVELLKKFTEYLHLGSFPQVIKTKNLEFLTSYFNDILYRDIIARFSLKDIKEIKELAFYLASNIGKPMSYNNLAKLTGIRSLSTLKNYWDYFQQSYLFFKLNKFDFSVKKQIYNPAKNYIIDVALANKIGFFFTEEKGRALENIVFIELKRRGKNIFYHSEKHECDFVIKQKKIAEAIQVCLELSEENKQREIEGLIEALQKYKLKEGLILTLDEEFSFVQDGKKIIVMPVW